MGAVVQSGLVTPTHLAKWVTDGVLADGGSTFAQQVILGLLLGADFNTTDDQPVLIPTSIVAFQIISIFSTNASVSMTTAAGGFYTGANKTGTTLVSGSETYSNLTDANQLTPANLQGVTTVTRWNADNLNPITPVSTPFFPIYFSLTTPQGAAATADIYITGIPLSR